MGMLAAIDVLNQTGPEFLKTFFLLLACAIIAAFASRWLARAPFDSPSRGDELLRTPCLMAYLAGGARRAVDTTISVLFIAGALSPGSTGRTFHVTTARTARTDPLECQLLDAAGPLPGRTRDELQRGVSGELARVGQELRMHGLIPAAGGLPVRFLTALPLLPVLALGTAKVMVGLEHQKPVAILVLLCVLTMVGALIALAIPVLRTVRGDRVLHSMKTTHAALQHAAAAGTEPIGPDQVPVAVALFGAAALATTPYAALSTMFAPPRPPPGGSSGDSASSCSSSSCSGGGGGGCGGCSS